MGLPALQAQSCQGHSPHCSFTASRGHMHVYRHIHTHTCALARVCTDRRHVPRHSSLHGLHIHVCAHMHTVREWCVNTVMHSCTRTLAQHMQVHLCTHMRTRALTHVHTHVPLWTSTRAHSQKCSHGCAHIHMLSHHPWPRGRALAPPGLRLGPQGLRESRPPSPPLHPCDPICNKKPDAEIGENCSFLK